MKKSFATALSNASKQADQERKEYLQKLEDEAKARWEALKGYRTLEENFGLPLQAMVYAHTREKGAIAASLKVIGKPDAPSIRMDIDKFRSKGHIEIKLLENGNVTMDVSKDFYGTMRTDKVEKHVKPFGHEMSLDEAQEALAILIANNGKKFRRVVQNTVAWGRFMNKSLITVMNDEQKCANKLVGLHDKPKTTMMSLIK